MPGPTHPDYVGGIVALTCRMPSSGAELRDTVLRKDDFCVSRVQLRNPDGERHGLVSLYCAGRTLGDGGD